MYNVTFVDLSLSVKVQHHAIDYNYLTVYILFRGTFVTQSLWRNKQMEQITYKILIAYLYNYEFGLSLCKIVRSSVILLLPLFDS